MYDEVWEQLESLLHSQSSLIEDWQTIIHSLVQNNQDSYNKYLAIDTAIDKQEIKEWIIETIKAFTIPDNTVVIKIGLFDTIYQDKEISALSITGYSQNIPNTSEDAEFLVYAPENRYFVPDGLNALRSILQSEKDNSDFFLWILPICYIAILFKSTIFETIELPEHIKIVCGYTDGDYIEIPH